MNAQEAKIQEERLAKFKTLDQLRREAYDALKELWRDWESGPRGQSPFTGNTRESRKVKSLTFVFTATLGGAPPVSFSIDNLYVSAWELRNAIEGMVKARIETIEKEINAL